MTSPIPATIITGFLGAGKTTLIQNLIRTAGGKRLALIVNEFGDLGFDGEQIAGCGIEGCAEDDVIELTNGCICCTVADDFLPSMQALLARDPAPDHIIIETSGLALPQPLLQAFNWPGVASRTTVDGVVTVADAQALAGGLYAADGERVAQQRAADPSLDHETPIEELFGDQLRCADLIVLSKSDQLDDEGITSAEAKLAGKRSGVGVVHSTADGLPAALLLGLGAEAEADARARRSQHELDHHHGDHEHGHHHHHHHDHGHDAFASKVLALDPFGSREAVQRFVESLCAKPRVLRVKGTVAVAGKPVGVEVQAVGPRIATRFVPEAPARSALVVIGTAPLDLSDLELSSSAA